MSKTRKVIFKILIIVAIFLLWNTAFIKPLKIFTVFLHELGHFIAAKVAGFHVNDFQISMNESGFVSFLMPTNAGFLKQLFVGSAGYLGSLIFAVIILNLRTTKYRRTLLIFIGVISLLISIFYSGFSFMLIFSICLTILITIIVKMNKPTLEILVLEIAGFSSIIYALYDTFIDTIVYYLIWGQKIQTDSVALSNASGIPAILWGFIWTGIALFIFYKTLKKEINDV